MVFFFRLSDKNGIISLSFFQTYTYFRDVVGIQIPDMIYKPSISLCDVHQQNYYFKAHVQIYINGMCYGHVIIYLKNKNPTMCILWKLQLHVVSHTWRVVHVGFILHTFFIHLDCSHFVIIKVTSRVQWRFPRHQNHRWIDDLDCWTFHNIWCWNSPFCVAYSKSSYVLRIITTCVQVLLVNEYIHISIKMRGT